MLKFDKKKRKTGDFDVGDLESKSKKVRKALKEGKTKPFKEKVKKRNSPVENDPSDVHEVKGEYRDVVPKMFSNVKGKNKSKSKTDEEIVITTVNSNEIDVKNVRKDQVKTKQKNKKKKWRNIDVSLEETATEIPVTDACDQLKTPKIKKNEKRKNEMKKKTGKKFSHDEDSTETRNTDEKNSPTLENDESAEINSSALRKKKKLNQDDDETDSPPNRKEFVRQKLTEERLKKGLVMLSSKTEAKIYKLKKALKRKGLAAEEIRQIVRKRRRAEELKQRHSDEVCYRCRQPGHRFADCQLVVRDNEQGTGVCFRCGSTEHILRDCTASRAKKGRLPYAKCFVCGLQGHISRECPSNPKGAFPKGGKCNVCGSINHLKRDCPQLMEKDQDSFTAKVMRTGLSADSLDD